VNEALALEAARDCGIALFPLAPKEGPPDAGYDAVLCDWDFWPAELRQDLLAERDGPPHRPLAVHGYNLDEAQAEALRSRGVVVHAGLQPEVFLQLRQAAASAQPAAAPPRVQDETEGVVSPA
jgi:hypothetical protein